MGRLPEPAVGRTHWPSAGSDGRRFRLGGHLFFPHFLSSQFTSEVLQLLQSTCCFLRGVETEVHFLGLTFVIFFCRSDHISKRTLLLAFVFLKTTVTMSADNETVVQDAGALGTAGPRKG